MALYDYSTYSEDELRKLLADIKVEREKFLTSASDSGSSYSRQEQEIVEKKFNGIVKALSKFDPVAYPRKSSFVRMGVR